MEKKLDIYGKSLYHWNTYFSLPTNLLYDVYRKYDLQTVTHCVDNLLRLNCKNINEYVLTVNNESYSLIEWAKHLLKTKYFFIRFLCLNGLEAMVKLIEGLLNETVAVDFKVRGKLLTVNGLTNNYLAWSIFCKNSGGYVSNLMFAYDQEYVIRAIKHVLSAKVPNEIVINDLHATPEQWSKFLNKPLNYVGDLIHKYGINYAQQFLRKSLINKKDNVRKSTIFTINNESNSLYKWALRINVRPETLYMKRRLKGTDEVLNFIIKKLNTQTISPKITIDGQTKTLNEWAVLCKKSNNFFTKFYNQYGRKATISLITDLIKAEHVKLNKIIKVVDLTVDGQTKTLNEWTEFFLDAVDIFKYYHEHGEKETIFYIKRILNNESYTEIAVIDGQVKTIRDWLKFLNLPSFWSFPKALLKQIYYKQIRHFTHQREKYLYVNGEWRSMNDCLQLTGYSKSYIRQQIYSGDVDNVIKKIEKRIGEK